MIEEFKFISSTGKEIYAKKWYDENNKQYKAIVQLVHGKTIKTENESGYFCKKDGWFRLTEDIHILQNKIKSENLQIPYIIMGYSMGSLLVRTYLTIYNFQNNISEKNMLYGNPVADAFLVAKAKTNQGTLVTSEKFSPNAAKIPNMCDEFNIDYIDFKTFLKRVKEYE